MKSEKEVRELRDRVKIRIDDVHDEITKAAYTMVVYYITEILEEDYV